MIPDRPSVERKAVTSVGYAITALAHDAFVLARAWPFVAVSRAVSWIARGSKAPARDSLLAGSVPPEPLGRAFGVERCIDSLGAVDGVCDLASSVIAETLFSVTDPAWAFVAAVLATAGATVLGVRGSQQSTTASPT